jgi:choline dehydrogenase-like flavoprotein
VIGVQRLRIVDASIFPDYTSISPTGALMMMAQKAATNIKKSYWRME